jgi:hypothetical protein
MMDVRVKRVTLVPRERRGNVVRKVTRETAVTEGK